MNGDSQMPKNVICLWYDGTAKDAAKFYAQIFPDRAVTAAHRAAGDYPDGAEGQLLTVDFTVLGVPCLNGGLAFTHSEAFSFQIITDDQAETDRYWNAIVNNGGTESRVRMVQGRMGFVLADHPANAPRRNDRSRPCGRQARVRGDDNNEKYRHRRHRSGTARTRSRLEQVLGSLPQITSKISMRSAGRFEQVLAGRLAVGAG
jgi:predicted 3-demethylubiquinone-9 3-methyltransferase (glyoxalase superfamily)